MKLNEIQVGVIYREAGRFGGDLLVTAIDQHLKVVKAKRVYLDESVENVEVPLDDLQLDYGHVNTYRAQQIRDILGTPEEYLADKKAIIAERRNHQAIRESHEDYIKRARLALAAIGIESRPHTTTTGRFLLGFDAHPLPYARKLDHAVLARRAGQMTEADVLAEMGAVHDRFLREQTIDFMERTVG